MDDTIGTKVLLVTVLTLLSVGFIALVYVTNVIVTIRPQPHRLGFMREIDQDTNDTNIVIEKDGEIIVSVKHPFIHKKLITIMSPFGKIIRIMPAWFNVTVDEMKETFNRASDIALADEQVKQIIGKNEYTLRGIPLRPSDSNVFKLFLRTVGEYYIMSVDLDKEQVTSIETTDDCWSKIPMRLRLLSS